MKYHSFSVCYAEKSLHVIYNVLQEEFSRGVITKESDSDPSPLHMAHEPMKGYVDFSNNWYQKCSDDVVSLIQSQCQCAFSSFWKLKWILFPNKSIPNMITDLRPPVGYFTETALCCFVSVGVWLSASSYLGRLIGVVVTMYLIKTKKC